MRIINFIAIVFLFFVLTSCDVRKAGKEDIWYHPQFGFLHIADNLATHYRIGCIEPEEWTYDNISEVYIDDDILYYRCKYEENNFEKIKIKTNLNKDDMLVLSSDHPCLGQGYPDGLIRLTRLSLVDKELRFSTVRVRANIDGKMREVILTHEDIVDVKDDDSLLTKYEQLWMVYEHRANLFQSGHTPVIKMEIAMGNSTVSDVVNVNTFPNPCYLRPLLTQFYDSLSVD